VRTTKHKVLPPPPAPFATRGRASGWDWLTGSPDRLVMARYRGNNYSSLDQNSMAVAAFDFRSNRWRQLPDSRYVPAALPDGLVAVGIPCERVSEYTMDCQVEVSTLHWDDTRWRHQQVTKQAVRADIDVGDINSGAYLLGVRGDSAYFRAFRGDDEQLLRVDVDGQVQRLPLVPVPPATDVFHDDETCPAPGGLISVAKQTTVGGDPPGTGLGTSSYGPIHRLDVRAAKPRWRIVPDTSSLAVPSTGRFVCGAEGLVLMAPPKTSTWAEDRFVTLAPIGTPQPPDPRPERNTFPLADGELAFADDRAVHWLRGRRWREKPVLTKPGDDQLFDIATVGDLIVYQVLIYDTDRTELRVIR